jgi:hypothetical protein
VGDRGRGLGNIVFYVANALGAANPLSRAGFFGAYAGALVAPVALLVLARAAFTSARSDSAR